MKKYIIKFIFVFIVINTCNAGHVIHHEILDNGTLYAFTFSEDQQYCIFATTTQIQMPTHPAEYSNYKLKRLAITIIKTDLNFNVIEATSFVPKYCHDTVNCLLYPSICDFCKQDIVIYDIIESNGYYYLCGKINNSAYIVKIHGCSVSFNKFNTAKTFNSLCSRGDELFVVGQSIDDKGCCYRINKNNLNIANGFKTIAGDWVFHKIINSGEKVILSGTNGSMTGFVSINPDNSIYASKQFQNSVQPDSRAVLTRCPGNDAGFIIATSESNQIRTFVFNDSVFQLGIKYMNYDGSTMSLQDIDNNADKIAWVGNNDLDNSFYISSNFNNNTFINPPFFNRYLSYEDEYFLFKTHYNFQVDQFYCGGFSTDLPINVRETFCAIPEISEDCDYISSLNVEDILITELEEMQLIFDSIVSDEDVNLLRFTYNIDFTKLCNSNGTTQKSKNSINFNKYDIIEVHVSDDIIKIDNISENVDYIIFSIDGKIIKKGQINSNTISIDDLSRGIYLLQLIGEDINITKKIFK
jgi:hypothetical protein